MAKLSYYPEGVDLQGKQKIYFTCHPDDFDTYFKSVCSDLLAGNRDCVIAYNSEQEKPWDEKTMKFELAQMRLMVIPVTAKFLCKPSEVRDVELSFIMNNTDLKIPVLPLMQESGLDMEYSRVFRDLQYLDKNVRMTDPTALPYDQKLKKYLDSIIFSPELVKKIRQAFDAYIFMSYRKMDRVYAQELMKLIHKNDFCRDIAIWYDEFLTPGESFNHVIREALEKSKLFTLVVTPNILEPNDRGETNYVVQYEYPEAVKSGKPILPAEMVPTDLNALHEKLDNATGEGDFFPAPTDGNDAEAISQALQDKLPQDLLDRIRSIAIDENNTDPQHNFFIGLAYLGGIDVEVDHEKALKLITSAAEQNLPEAMEKLADMYKNGEGVERNYETSAEWLEKVVDYREERYIESKSEEDGDKLFWALWLAAHAWDELNRLIKVRVKCEKMLSVSKELNEKFGGVNHLSCLALSYGRMGNICAYEFNLSEARKWYEKCLTIYECLAEKTGKAKYRLGVAVSYSNIGDVCDFTEAIMWYEKSLLTSRRLVDETGKAAYRGLLSSICDKIAGACKDKGKLDEARKWCQNSLDIREPLANTTGKTEDLRDLAFSYEVMGDLRRLDNSISEAKQWYARSLKIREQLVDKFELLRDRYSLHLSYIKLGDIYKIEGDLSEARALYEKDLFICEHLAEEAVTIEDRRDHQRDLSESYKSLGDICSKEAKRTEARKWYEKELELKTKLAEETESDADYDNLVNSYLNFVLQEDVLSHKIKLLKKAEVILGRLVEQYPDKNKYTMWLCFVQYFLDRFQSEIHNKSSNYMQGGEKMYEPRPIDTSEVVLSEELLALTEKIAENVHDVWAVGRISEGWVYGEVKDSEKKTTPLLVPYSELSESEKEYDRNTALESIKLIVKMGYEVKKSTEE